MAKSIVDPSQRLFDLCPQTSGRDFRAEVAKALAGDATRINARNDCGDTPLICALQYENVELARVLLDFEAEPDAEGGHAQTALMAAAEKGLAEMCSLLLGKGADVNVVDDLGGTALMSAIGFEHSELCPMFLPSKVTDIRHRDGCTALLLAVFGNDRGTCRLLIEHGATMSHEDWLLDGLRDLHDAVQSLLSHARIGDRDLFEAKGRPRDEVLFMASDSQLWAKLFATLRQDWNQFKKLWACFPPLLQARLTNDCDALAKELASRSTLTQLQKARKGTSWLERPESADIELLEK